MTSLLIVDKDKRSLIKNRVGQYPHEFLDYIDTAVKAGRGAVYCIKYLKLNYKGPLPIPALNTMSKWVEQRREYFTSRADQLITAQSQIANLPPIPDMRAVDPSNKGAALDAIFRVLTERVEVLRGLQENLADPRNEKVLIDSLVALKDLVQASVEMDGKMGGGQVMIDAIKEILLKYIAKSVSLAYKEVHGDKDADKFQRAVAKRIGEINHEAVESEVKKVVAQRQNQPKEM